MNQAAYDIEEMIRAAEVRAVANVIRQAGSVQLGQMIDYRLESGPDGTRQASRRGSRPYRLLVEQWHIDAAAAMLLGSEPRSF